MLLGNVTLVSPVHPEKPPMTVNPSANVNLFNAVHESNAASPMDVTDDGRVTSVRLEFLLKDPSPIVVTPSLIINLVKPRP